MNYTQEELKLMSSPPLEDGNFSVILYTEWARANKKLPEQMLYTQWLENIDYLKVTDYSLYLTQMKHWFNAVSIAISKGTVENLELIEDYNSRMHKSNV